MRLPTCVLVPTLFRTSIDLASQQAIVRRNSTGAVSHFRVPPDHGLPRKEFGGRVLLCRVRAF